MDPVMTPELLAPAGDRRALRAALAAGADAVYFGLERWSARAFAGNFALEHAVEAVELAHLYGARAHLALNTLLKDDEVEPALAALEAAYAAGLDALIVADLGFAARAREQYPGLPLHASTQMNTHSSAQLAALAGLGFDRAILARELSLDEIAALEPHGLDLETFVHGALCYGYSGDCLLSSMVGGRSGNRGRCSQSCRMRYGISVQGSGGEGPATTGAGAAHGAPAAGAVAAHDAPAARVMSTADLCAIGALPQLLRAGVRSFKIEGRMKDAAYVAVTTSVYREGLDAAAADPGNYRVLPVWIERLEQAFSRGFTTAHLEGRHHEVRSGGRGGHRGVLVGRVERVDESGGTVVVRLAKPVAEGDTLAVYTPWGQTEPFRVPEAAADRLTLRLHERVAAKDRVFRLAAAEADAFARDLIAGRAVVRPVGVAARLEGRAGEPARLTLRAEPDGPEVAAESDETLAPARRAALDEARVRAALGALGGTPYRLAVLDLALDEGLFLPVGELKGLRRRAVAALDGERLAARRRRSGRHSPAATEVAAALAAGAAAASAAGVAASAANSAATPTAASVSASAANSAATPTAASASASAAARPAAFTAASRGQQHDLPVVLVVRSGDEPLAAPGVVALCLELQTSDPPEAVVAAARRLAGLGLPLRCRPPEVLFDADVAWWRALAGEGWSAVYLRHLGLLRALPAAAGAILEYPLQGLSAGAATVVRRLAVESGDPPGRSPAGVVASPEASLEEIGGLVTELGRLDPPPAVEALAFGRQQVLRTRDQLGRAEGLYEAPGPREQVDLLLEDTKGYGFPAAVDVAGMRLFNARVTNLAANLDELVAAGVSAVLVVQSDMNVEERRAFAAGGLPALAPFATRERTTRGHLFRGVA
ncbi:MAG: U32 family peptidase [Thermoleophilia bacterium]|nr:U32 family peptidase [Thermoleophilia bacterium]